MERKIDIYGTMGPACSDIEILKKMFDEGMTGMRWNLSHISLREAEATIRLYHKAAEESGVKAGLLIDLQGPELRLGNFSVNHILKEDELCVLGEDGIPVPEIVIPYLKEGQRVLLDDGKILVEITKQERSFAHARILRGGILSPRKSIALEGCNVPVPTLTAQDIENLKEAKHYGVTAVMQPFVRNVADLLKVRETMKECGCEDIRLFAKIENQNGIDNLTEFFNVADEIVIARGDLGNAMPLWELPGVQKRIAAQCREAKTPFMVVTQMLASMEKSAVPTRAEVSDIYNAVCDGASSVMVTGETAVGSYPVEVIRYLSRTAKEALKERKI